MMGLMLNYVIRIDTIVFLEKEIETTIVIMKGMSEYENYKTEC